MKYSVSGMFRCEVEANNWREAEAKGKDKAYAGEVEIYIMSVDEEVTENAKCRIQQYG